MPARYYPHVRRSVCGRPPLTQSGDHLRPQSSGSWQLGAGSSQLPGFRYSGNGATDRRSWELGELGQILAFGEDFEGELYVLSMNGRVYKIVPG